MHLNNRSAILLLVFVVLGAYYPAIFAPLNSIDDPDMYNYLLNTDSFTLRGIFTPNGGNYFRPILVLSYMMDKYVWGLEESYMHLENVVFHLCNTLMVFALVRRVRALQGLTSAFIPFIAALLFAIHPLNTETVAWIAGRTDLLAGFFIFLSVWLLFSIKANLLTTVSAASCMLISCLAKETAIFFLPAALLFPFYVTRHGDASSPQKPDYRTIVSHQAIFLVMSAAYFAFRSGAFTRHDAGVRQVLAHVGGEKSAGLLNTMYIVLKSAGFYLKKLFVPFPLNFGITHVSNAYILIGIVCFIFVAWLLFNRTITTYFFICAAMIGSSALVIPLLKQTWTPLAERYMYIPLAFFIIGLTLAVSHLKIWGRYHAVMSCLIFAVVCIAVYGTTTRTILWQDNLAFYQDTLKKSPDFVPAQNELAKALYERGRTQEATKIISSFQISQDLLNRQYGELSRAAALANNKDFVGARALLNSILKDPGKHEVLILQWLLEMDKRQIMSNEATLAQLYPESVKTLTRLIELTGNPFYSYRLGIIHMQVGENAKALQQFQVVVDKTDKSAYYRESAVKLAAKLAR